VREDLARVVYKVLSLGLRYHRRLEREVGLSLDGVQSELKRELGLSSARQANGLMGEPSGDYWGYRYALVCWLDELFIIYSPWRDQWNPKALEPILFHDRLRGPLFWRQAALASARADLDGMEVFYLCVLLGFRGDLRDYPQQLQEWQEKFETQLGLRRRVVWSEVPAEKPLPPTDVPPLTARDRLRWLLLAVGIMVGVGILAGVFLATVYGAG